MSEPLYRHVFNSVIERIENGLLTPGAMLPNEHALAEEFNVSHGTIRKAMMHLEQNGTIKRIQGKGTFVSAPTAEETLFHFFRLRRKDGSFASPKLVKETLSRRAATAHEKETLFGAPEEVLVIERVRSLDGENRVLEYSVVNPRVFPGLEDRAPLPNTLYELYQQAFNCVVHRVTENVSIDFLNNEQAHYLDSKEGEPQLSVERTAFDMSDRCVELRTSINVINNLHYNIEIK